MYLIKRIIKSYITIVNILVQSVFDVIRLVLSPLSLSLKLVLNRRKRRNDKPYRNDRYQSQIDGINTVIKKLSNDVYTIDSKYSRKHIMLRDVIRKNSMITCDNLIKTENDIRNVKLAIDELSNDVDNIDVKLTDKIQGLSESFKALNNRVNELELSQEDSTLTIFPDNEDMTIDEHVQHAMAAHEKEEGRVKEYDYHSELKAKEKSNE